MCVLIDVGNFLGPPFRPRAFQPEILIANKMDKQVLGREPVLASEREDRLDVPEKDHVPAFALLDLIGR